MTEINQLGGYMGGLAVMVISPKKKGIFQFIMFTLGIIQPHLMCFNDFIWTYNMLKYDQKIFAFPQQSKSNILECWFDNFKNLVSHKLEEFFLLNLKYDSLALVSAITWDNMTRF